MSGRATGTTKLTFGGGAFMAFQSGVPTAGTSSLLFAGGAVSFWTRADGAGPAATTGRRARQGKETSSFSSDGKRLTYRELGGSTGAGYQFMDRACRRAKRAIKGGNAGAVPQGPIQRHRNLHFT